MFLVFRLTVYFQPLRVYLPAGMAPVRVGLRQGDIRRLYRQSFRKPQSWDFWGRPPQALGLIADMISRLNLRSHADIATK
ncbi:MAG: hypothetical protein IPN48_05385 [Sphingomonadales bacterium]|nr:hypothetical protein [Sphingomonadales bacterium]